uniref:Protein TsetseEP n=1 Tax=Zeugodacus cucurbitae TaxID=28588 RepID=A0A0A1X7M7_ZEUCU
MQTIIFAILALALIGTTAAVPTFAVAKAQADEDIFYLLDQNIASGGSDNPKITTECFNYYMPILNKISVSFSVQYEQCVSQASQAAANLTATAAQQRTSFVNETTTICGVFTSCNSKSITLDFLSCYATATSTDTNGIYNLADSASNAAISLRGGLQQINDTEEICKNRAQQSMSTQTSKTYKELQACFTNGLPVVTTGTAAGF